MPPPSSTTTATIEYYSRLQVLSATVTTNWILEDYPDLYLYGSLLQATAYIGDDARLGLWKTAYDAALDACMASGKRARNSGPNLAMRAA